MAAKKKKLAKQTLNEFKAWLSGVEEMQEEGWLPNETQWELIRNRINLIIEPKPEKVEVPAPAQPAHSQQQQAVIPSFPTAGGSSLQNAHIVDNGSSLSAPPVGPAINPANPVVVGDAKTPDIDSSGGYTSGFA